MLNIINTLLPNLNYKLMAIIYLQKIYQIKIIEVLPSTLTIKCSQCNWMTLLHSMKISYLK